MIKAVKFVSIPVHDQDRALSFYTDKLGFTVATDQPFNDQQRWIELRIPGADTRLVLFTPDGHENRIGDFQPIAFLSADVDKTYLELRARGVAFTAAPVTAEWGSSVIFSDSEGNQFVISSK